MEQPILKAKGLTMRYHSAVALDNLDLELPQGKIVGLLGPNGSGKTTFIKLAAGLLTPTSGEITIGGNKIGTETKAVVSYLPDRPYFSRQLRVEQQMDFFQDFYADFDRARAEAMLTALNISTKAKFKARRPGLHSQYHHHQLRPQRHGADLHPSHCRRGAGAGRISIFVSGSHRAGRQRGHGA